MAKVSLHCDIASYSPLAAEAAQVPKDGLNAHQKNAGKATQCVQSYYLPICFYIYFFLEDIFTAWWKGFNPKVLFNQYTYQSKTDILCR